MCPSRARAAAAALLVAVAGGWAAPAGAKQVSDEQKARMLLDSARRAYNEGNYQFARRRFEEFVQRYSSHKNGPSAWYGLGLSMLAWRDVDYRRAAEAFERAAARRDLPERPYALYYLALSVRKQGDLEQRQVSADPSRADRHRRAADQYYRKALQHFDAASKAFAERLKAAQAATAPAAQPPVELEWLARAQCDHAEMLLRAGESKKAAEQTKAFLTDPRMTASRYREMATYHLGYALFEQGEHLAAGRALSVLAPFGQRFGLHARYLLARTHHLSADRPEAAAQYKAVLADYEVRKKAAREALRHSSRLKRDERDRLYALAHHHPPEYVIRASFYLSLLAAEEGRYADALKGFTELLQRYPKLPFAKEAQLRQGFCHLELRDFDKAIRALEPLRKDPKLGDQAMWWLARARVGAAKPDDEKAYARTLGQAIDLLRAAADHAARQAARNERAKVRRGDIMMELADTMLLAKRYDEAAATYQRVLGDKSVGDRAEEAMQRQVTALHLASKYDESDRVCRQFEQKYPRSTLLPAVLFRAAENAYLRAVAAADGPHRRSEREVGRLFDEAVRRYQRLVKDYSAFAYVNVARQGIAMAYYRRKDYARALETLKSIPDVDRHGLLANVPYLLADCYIRTLPDRADDALQAGRLVREAAQAAKLLEGYVAGQPKSPHVGDALLKLGHCYQRMAAVLVDAEQRKKLVMQARTAYDKLISQRDKKALAAAAYLERAKCTALLGDANNAMYELRRFQSDPLRQSSVAPLALLRYASLLRAAGKADDAAKMMQQCRGSYESALLKDAERRDWVPQLQYEHALAMMESGKPTEARKLFEALAKQFPKCAQAADAAWRAGQCRRREVLAALKAARAVMAKRNAGKQEIAAARQALMKALAELRQAAADFRRRADGLAKTAGASRARLRLLYEAAWCYRVLAEAEIDDARRRMREAALEKVRAKMAKRKAGEAPAMLRAPRVAIAAVPIQPSEKAAREQYDALLTAAAAHKTASGEGEVATQARFEVAEMSARRGRHDAALDMLADALANNPAAPLARRIRLRIASSLLAKGRAKDALPYVQRVVKETPLPRSGQASRTAAEARYLAGEVYIQQRDWAKAIEQLAPFRDRGQLQSLQGVSDRALLRLGFAYAQAGRWADSRRALETLVSRFRESPWADEGYYGIGWAYQKQHNYDQAVNAYVQVTRRTAGEVAARAQLQIGLCRLAQKRYEQAARDLLVVPFTYDCPQWNAPAWCQAAQAYLQLKQTKEAVKLWQRVIKDHPESSWARLAREGLAKVEPPADG